MSQQHVEIAGAGFAGVTFGTILAQHGWSVRIHERAAECRQFGAGIWFWENGLRVLNAIGAIDEALEGAVMPQFWEGYDERGKVIERVPFGDHDTGGRVFCIVRQKLYAAILHAAEKAGVEILTNSRATGATAAGELLIEGDKRYKADLVVGADGVNSKVRDSLGLLKRRWTHSDGAIRVNVPRTQGEAADPRWQNIYEWWSGPRRLLYTPCSGEEIYLCLTSIAADKAALQIPVPKEVWRRSFPQAADYIDRIPDISRWDRFETIYVDGWSRGRSAILGDAAHAMVPGLGQGCGMAVTNAMALATALAEESTIERALAAWEQRMRPLVKHTQFWSWTTWPLTRVPAGVARTVFNLPVLSGWIHHQRALPSLEIPPGTEKDARWRPAPRAGDFASRAMGAQA
jgi:2-polyprenyl-6-methoxyphenol hydroxylase-like FAD-dependent oxidoreductase